MNNRQNMLIGDLNNVYDKTNNRFLKLEHKPSVYFDEDDNIDVPTTLGSENFKSEQNTWSEPQNLNYQFDKMNNINDTPIKENIDTPITPENETTPEIKRVQRTPSYLNIIKSPPPTFSKIKTVQQTNKKITKPNISKLPISSNINNDTISNIHNNDPIIDDDKEANIINTNNETNRLRRSTRKIKQTDIFGPSKPLNDEEQIYSDALKNNHAPVNARKILNLKKH